MSSPLQITEGEFFLKITLHLRLVLMIVCGITVSSWHLSAKIIQFRQFWSGHLISWVEVKNIFEQGSPRRWHFQTNGSFSSRLEILPSQTGKEITPSFGFVPPKLGQSSSGNRYQQVKPGPVLFTSAP